MTTRKQMTAFEPGHGFTKDDWDEVSDNPELTEAEIAAARPFAEVFPELAESIRRTLGRPKAASPKKLVSLRLDADVIAGYRAGGPGWQSRINAALRKALREDGAAGVSDIKDPDAA